MIERLNEMIESPYEYDYSVKLAIMSEYFMELADFFDKNIMDIENFKLVNVFEEVYLILLDNLCFIPTHLKEEILRLVNTYELNKNFMLISFNGARLAKRNDFTLTQIFIDALRNISGSFITVGGHEQSEEIKILKNVSDIKVSLIRISKMLKHAIKSSDYDFAYDDNISRNFNPSFVNKSKLFDRLFLLEKELHVHKDDPEIQITIENIQIIKEELKHKMPNWKRIFSIAFVILGILSNLKTIAPDQYSTAKSAAEGVVNQIFHESQVENSRTNLNRLIDNNTL